MGWSPDLRGVGFGRTHGQARTSEKYSFGYGVEAESRSELLGRMYYPPFYGTLLLRGDTVVYVAEMKAKGDGRSANILYMNRLLDTLFPRYEVSCPDKTWPPIYRATTNAVRPATKAKPTPADLRLDAAFWELLPEDEEPDPPPVSVAAAPRAKVGEAGNTGPLVSVV
jgi:hypothetical protein